MHVHRYERWWMALGLTMLGVFLTIITVAAVADNINPPGGMQQIDPTKVASTPPFDRPGLRHVAGNTYEAYYVAQVFSFTPASISVPLGSTVTFYVTSPDVVHGFFIANTAINMMVIPGWVNVQSHTFRQRGTYLLLCHEYCGLGHQNMFAKIEVQ